MITDTETISDSQTTTLKDILRNFTESSSPVFQRVLNLVNEIMLATIHGTKYCEKLSAKEKEQLSRELTASFLSMILGKFTKKTS
ncbi:MAG: hypothetical protein A3I68_01855 [Candidatus Melainabacteria bacterium RIFCSPLOWO2_02_FULL_35_15]|nr:MAG: hypothetical protein A3F80_09510 [Candidatus Melainabacteria bacterium RIFCSPLOWO2_12_FULL_35_11]OGI14299.1 MAG: hypothetical protein A3I68_01855 [Candidatus Melainabacteria bacterium RIFCSPLOWO2_02_FULL_35_15]